MYTTELTWDELSGIPGYDQAAAERRRKQQLRDGWVEILMRHQWDVYVTLTFRCRSFQPQYCHQQFQEWLLAWEAETAIERGLAFWEYRTQGQPILKGKWANARKHNRHHAQPVWFTAIEPHESGELHLHSLIKCSNMLPEMDTNRGKEIWESRHHMNNGICDITDEFDVPEFICAYVSKTSRLPDHCFAESKSF